MQKRLGKWLLVVCLLISQQVFAMLSMELTRGVSGAIPIGIVPFSTKGNIPGEDISAIISNDLKNSGRFKVYSDSSSSNIKQLQSLGADNLLTGTIEAVGNNKFRVAFSLSDLYKQKGNANGGHPLLHQSFVISGDALRRVAHHISDMVYQQILGVRGVFSTRLAYIVVERNNPPRYRLEVSDQDGYNPKPLLISKEPIMSPAWSPDGKQIAYVSFEKKRPSIFIQNVSTGSRYKVTSYPGINGAPAWSPDGKKLALVLSKEGTPNIYVLDLATKHLTKVTSDWSINTEPSWSPNGRSLLFTSNRSGGPQIYQKNLQSGALTRLTYDGNYNARASFTQDGNHIVVLNQEDKMFNIGVLDLESGVFRALTTSSGTDSESPSVAPNGSMVLYGTLYEGRSILAMAATDGSVQIRLPARNGEVQDPAWSPFL